MTDVLEQARDPRTSAELLARLALQADGAVRLAVAANPSSRRATAEELLRGGPRSGLAAVAGAVLGNASLPLWLLDDPAWLTRLPSEVASVLARSPALTPLGWEALCEHATRRVRVALARSPVAPADAWSRLALVGNGTWDFSQEGLEGDDIARLLACARRAPASPSVSGAGEAREESALASVTTLKLARNSLGDEGVEALARFAPLPALTALVLSQNQVTDQGLSALARSPHLRQLEQLNLSLNHLRNQGLVSLAQSTSLPNLTGLYLRANEVGTRGVEALCESTSLPRLGRLDLSGNPLGDSGAQALVRAPFFASLVDLRLVGCDLGEASKRQLREAAAEVAGMTLMV